MVEVVAALVWRDGKILICRRPADKTRPLLWEFPGGKVEAGETKQQALVRECREELAFEVVPGSVFCEVTHTYLDITIHLTLFNCTAKGEPQQLEHAELAWVLPQDVTAYDFCPADKVIVGKLARGVKLQTERLELRELTARDIDNLRPILQDADVMYAWKRLLRIVKQKTGWRKICGVIKRMVLVFGQWNANQTACLSACADRLLKQLTVCGTWAWRIFLPKRTGVTAMRRKRLLPAWITLLIRLARMK